MNHLFGYCSLTGQSSQIVYLPAGDVTTVSASELHSCALKSRLLLHEQQNLKGVIKAFSKNNNKKETTATASIIRGSFGFVVLSIFT